MRDELTLLPINAMGTTWWLELYDDCSTDDRQHTHRELAVFLAQFEARYSRFQSDSWLSQLNSVRTWQQPDSEFVALLQYGLEAYRRTDGVFNFLIGNELIARGYDAAYQFNPTTPPPPPPDPHNVLTITENEIRLASDWTIDVGGYGKGYAIDLATDLLHRQGHQYFLLNGGGDLYVTSNHGLPITIHLEHPTQSGFGLGAVSLKNSGFAASSPFKRQWRVGEQTYSHLMPQPSQPGAVATFVIADSARDADVFATTTALIDEPNCSALTAREPHLRLARYTPTTSTWWSSQWPISPTIRSQTAP